MYDNVTYCVKRRLLEGRLQREELGRGLKQFRLSYIQVHNRSVSCLESSYYASP